MRRIPAVAAALALALAAGGCLMSVTDSFTYEVGNINLNPGTGSFDKQTIDLSNNSTFQDNKDNIKLIDRLGFTCGLVNNTSSTQKVSVYFSTNSGLTEAQVPTQATPLFKDVDVPATASGATPDRLIGYDESVTLLQNFDAFADVVQGGSFTLYTLSTGDVDVDIDSLVLIITFTAST